MSLLKVGYTRDKSLRMSAWPRLWYGIYIFLRCANFPPEKAAPAPAAQMLIAGVLALWYIATLKLFTTSTSLGAKLNRRYDWFSAPGTTAE
jgi:hypothetical protein